MEFTLFWLVLVLLFVVVFMNKLFLQNKVKKKRKKQKAISLCIQVCWKNKRRETGWWPTKYAIKLKIDSHTPKMSATSGTSSTIQLGSIKRVPSLIRDPCHFASNQPQVGLSGTATILVPKCSKTMNQMHKKWMVQCFASSCVALTLTYYGFMWKRTKFTN